MTCELCGVSFQGRSHARFCSGRCRVAAHRAERVGNLPSVLTSRDRWILHDARKVPRQVDGRPASSTNPATWASFGEVSRQARGRGLGFVLNGDGIACIDLDKCLVGGVLAGWAADILAAVGRTYVEVSPSGSGLHIWGKAVVGKGRRMGGVEVYDRGRYMTVTGRVWADAPMRVAGMQRLVDDLLTRPEVSAA
jgi:primase-polymerase (primpol)-like protein